MAALFLVVLPLACVAWQAPAQGSKIDEVVQELRRVQRYSEPSISPDGHWVTWTQAESIDGKGPALYLLDRTKPGSQPKQIVGGEGDVPSRISGVSWAPDSSR